MNQKLELLASSLSKVAEQEKNTLNDLKQGYDDIKRHDFLWHYLLQSFSTMGRSAGWYGLIGNKNNYNRIVFLSLIQFLTKMNEVVLCMKFVKMQK